jgi:hypothetical protein
MGSHNNWAAEPSKLTFKLKSPSRIHSILIVVELRNKYVLPTVCLHRTYVQPDCSMLPMYIGYWRLVHLRSRCLNRQFLYMSSAFFHFSDLRLHRIPAPLGELYCMQFAPTLASVSAGTDDRCSFVSSETGRRPPRPMHCSNFAELIAANMFSRFRSSCSSWVDSPDIDTLNYTRIHIFHMPIFWTSMRTWCHPTYENTEERKHCTEPPHTNMYTVLLHG